MAEQRSSSSRAPSSAETQWSNGILVLSVFVSIFMTLVPWDTSESLAQAYFFACYTWICYVLTLSIAIDLWVRSPSRWG